MRRDRYGGFAELFAHETGGEDYAITVIRRPSSAVGVIAPHGARSSRERRRLPAPWQEINSISICLRA